MVEVLVALGVFLLCCFAFYQWFKASSEVKPNIDVVELISSKAVLEAERVGHLQNIEGLQKQLESVQSELAKVINQKKSSEVKTGLIAEHMAPFISEFPFDPKAARHLGVPIDYVVFDDAGVHFIEIKSGDASLTTSQRKIRDQINNKQVSFQIFRIK